MSDLHSEVKQMIIDVLALEDVSVADIDDAAPLFGDGLGWTPSMPWNWVWP